MSTLRVLGVSGSARRPSRTSALIETIGREISRRRETEFTFVDVAGIGPGLGASSRSDLPPEAEAALQAIEGADALVVGSPIYKGSYAGLFKHLFDFVDPLALVGIPVIVTATGGGRRHALAVEHQLRPLFGFFSALTLPTSVYASDEDFSAGVLSDRGTLDRVAQAAAELVAYARPTARTKVPPVPLQRVA